MAFEVLPVVLFLIIVAGWASRGQEMVSFVIPVSEVTGVGLFHEFLRGILFSWSSAIRNFVLVDRPLCL